MQMVCLTDTGFASFQLEEGLSVPVRVRLQWMCNDTANKARQNGLEQSATGAEIIRAHAPLCYYSMAQVKVLTLRDEPVTSRYGYRHIMRAIIAKTCKEVLHLFS